MGLMGSRRPPCRRRFVVVSEPNPSAATSRRAWAPRGPLLSDDLAAVQHERVEGFDMARSSPRLGRDPQHQWTSVASGRLDRDPRHPPPQDISLDVNEIVFKLLTDPGLAAGDYGAGTKMTVMLQSGLDIRPAITHRFPFTEHEGRLRGGRSGESGKVIMDWIAFDASQGWRSHRWDPRRARTRSPTSTTSWPRCGSATCTGRCG